MNNQFSNIYSLSVYKDISYPWGFIVYCIVTIMICSLILLGSWLLGSQTSSLNKIPFESGTNPIGSARLRFSAKFYLIAMLFVIFDVEAVYLYIWSITINKMKWDGLIEVSLFILILLSELIYLLRINALEWTKYNKKFK
ncbi:MAG: NADH-quinone oxidoreductase subunit A [Candidatus Dasytiphilus stammeri]